MKTIGNIRQLSKEDNKYKFNLFDVGSVTSVYVCYFLVQRPYRKRLILLVNAKTQLSSIA